MTTYPVRLGPGGRVASRSLTPLSAPCPDVALRLGSMVFFWNKSTREERLAILQRALALLGPSVLGARSGKAQRRPPAGIRCCEHHSRCRGGRLSPAGVDPATFTEDRMDDLPLKNYAGMKIPGARTLPGTGASGRLLSGGPCGVQYAPGRRLSPHPFGAPSHPWLQTRGWPSMSLWHPMTRSARSIGCGTRRRRRKRR